MKLSQVMKRLRDLSDPAAVEGMARFGIISKKAFGISAPDLRLLAQEIGTDQQLSLQLWKSGYFEARVIASLIGDPSKVTEEQMDRWVEDFDSWAVCDTCCGNLFDKTPFAYRKALEWSKRNEEYVKRAGYVLMAELAVHDKRANDEGFVRFFPAIKRGATDERNFVKKAVNWVLRQIGKRSMELHPLAVKTAEDIRRMDSSSAKWIASDALRELKSAGILRRLQNKKKKERSRVQSRQ